MKFYWIFLWTLLTITIRGQEGHPAGEAAPPPPADPVPPPTQHHQPAAPHADTNTNTAHHEQEAHVQPTPPPVVENTEASPTPTDNAAPPTPQQHSPPPVEHPPPHEAPAVQHSATSTEHVPPPTEHVPPVEHAAPTENVPPPVEHTPPPHQTPAPAADHVPPPAAEHIPPPVEHTPPPVAEHIPPPTQHTPTDHTPPPTEHTPTEHILPVVDHPSKQDDTHNKFLQVAQQVHQAQSTKSQSTNVDYGHVRAYSFYLRAEPQDFFIHLKHAQTIKGVLQVYKQEEGTYLAGSYQPGEQVQITVLENQYTTVLTEIFFQTSGFQFHGKPDTDYIIRFAKNGVDKLILLHMENFVESSKIDDQVISQEHITHHDRRATYIRDKLTTFMTMTQNHASINEDISNKVVQRLKRYEAYHWFQMFMVAFISLFQIFIIRRLVQKNTFVI